MFNSEFSCYLSKYCRNGNVSKISAFFSLPNIYYYIVAILWIFKIVSIFVPSFTKLKDTALYQDVTQYQ